MRGRGEKTESLFGKGGYGNHGFPIYRGYNDHKIYSEQEIKQGIKNKEGILIRFWGYLSVFYAY